MGKRTVSSGSQLEEPVGFSRAVRIGNLIAVAGTAPIRPAETQPLEGSTPRPDESEDTKLYGKKVTNEQILQGDLTIPNGARPRPLVAELNRYRNGGTNGAVGASLRDKGRVTLSNLHFKTGKADITADSEASLNDAVTALKEHADWNIRVEGFTDNVGSPEGNLKLSSDRDRSTLA